MVPEDTTPPTIGSLLRAAYDSLAREVYGRTAEMGFADLRLSHSVVFRRLPDSGARTVELAARAGMRKQSMGALLDDLQTMGYVTSSPDPSDRRAQVIRFTERGLQARRTLESLSAQTEAVWAEQVGVEEWKNARRTLEKLAKSFDLQNLSSITFRTRIG